MKAPGKGGHWIATRGNYLFPVKALSRHFRGRMVARLRRAAQAGELSRVTRAGEVDAVLAELMGTDWVVYTKDCLEHSATVVDYLARYTHRIALTNARILALDEATVTLRYKDYRDGGRHKCLTLGGAEFVRRFLHVLPRGLMRVRQFGFLANRGRAPAYPCPRCRVGRLRLIGELAPRRPEAWPPGRRR